MKGILKHIIIAITLFNLPMYGLKFSSTLGALISALALVALVLYYFFVKKSKPLLALLILGLLYYSISGLGFSGPIDIYMKDGFRYFLFIFSVTEVARNTTSKEACMYLVAGGASVIINALFFSDTYGRYAGFYINPNTAGLICIIGFAFSYTIKNMKYRLLAQVILTIGGIATLSRYFIILLVLINIASLFANRKNAIGLLAGLIGLVIIINTPAFELNSKRFEALKGLVTGQEVQTTTITRESRQETWAIYTDVILENLLIGKGYGALQGSTSNDFEDRVGVHNAYLMVLGEAGIIPFLLMVIFYLSLFFKSIKCFKTNPEFFYLALVITSFLMTSHNYFYNYIILFFTIWLSIKLAAIKESQIKNK